MKPLPVLVAVFLAAVCFGLWSFSGRLAKEISGPVTSYEGCVEAGYPVMESYPERCTTPEDRTFTRDIGNELEKADAIRIDAPRPNQAVASPLEVRGEARGAWYFEASFPVELLDGNGERILIIPARARGEWMTENFVPFAATLIFDTPTTATGTLVLRRDNPSGMPENDDALIVPVSFER